MIDLCSRLPDLNSPGNSIKVPHIILTNKIKSKYLPQEVLVDNNYWQEELSNTWHVPEGMHPNMYYNDFISEIENLQNNKNRNIGIFFSGNLDDKYYDWPIIKEKFHLLSRNKIIDIII